jgi:hypothetical protein
VNAAFLQCDIEVLHEIELATSTEDALNTGDVLHLRPLILTSPHLTVWYNTRCPVCDAGIDWQRNKLLAAVRGGHLSFVTSTTNPKHLRRRLHAADESGRLIVGADVAICDLADHAGARAGCHSFWAIA